MSDPATNHQISVVIGTYNRCEMLAEALSSILAQRSNGIGYEVIVVDNNSADRTREAVEAIAARAPVPLRYLFEGEQGISYARNAGIRQSRAPIIAFFDDDVRVAPDWIATIKREFDRQSEADCLGGKVLPIWQAQQPSWLTPDHWAPLALQDYGDKPFYIDPAKPLCLISANCAFRRDVFDRIGLFAPELQRVKNNIGSMEDLEFLIRFWRAGLKSLYLPDLIAETAVTAERVTKAYHRRWHRGHGHFYALLRAEEVEASPDGRLFDVPLHLYRQALIDAASLLKHSFRGRADKAFLAETNLRYFAGFFRRRSRDFFRPESRPQAGEFASFVRTIAGWRKPAAIK